MLKRLIFLFIAILTAGLGYCQQDDPVIMTVAGKDVTLSEFESIYNKNNNVQGAVDKKSLEEYVDLFVNFKLKVAEAESLGLDTVSAFIKELEGYRKQLTQPYLIDKELNENLIKEAYDRMTKDVHASHILVKVEAAAPPSDTLRAYNKVMKLRQKVTQGGMKFEHVAQKESEDPSAKQNAGDLGYFTVFQMVYPFETAAYNTEEGKVSQPVRTRFGYHLIKVHEKREARGQVKVAHIMVRTGKDMPEEEVNKAKSKIDEIYQQLQEGEDFNKLARVYSDDKASAQKGGSLPWFGTNRMVPEFENVAFELENNGDVSKPVKTEYGFHIIKRLDRKEIDDFESMKPEIKARVSRDRRASKSRTSLIRKIKDQYGFSTNQNALEKFYEVVDMKYFEGNWKPAAGVKLEQVLFTLKDTLYGSGKSVEIRQTDFADYLAKRSRKQTPIEVETFVNNMYDKYVEEVCIDFEESLLRYKYPEFRALMQEYRDGILLFELMDEKVWSKAVKDTTGLRKFYDSHKQDFLWEKRLEATIYTCANEDVAGKARKVAKKQFKKGYSRNDILEKLELPNQLDLKLESGKFQKGENEIIDQVNWISGISNNMEIDGKVVFVNVKQVIEPTPKTLNESRGLVTAAFQEYLEDQWIEALREKYDYSVNQEVLKMVK